jgi:uncharacterized secreted protein with C-terminal beta-propeller domain
MSLFRIFLLVLALFFVAIPSHAVSVAQRSPLAQGMWWDPAHSGHGFEIFSTSDQIGVGWFTYDENGRPVWYTAQGSRTSLGSQAWPLLQHRWVNGVKSGFTEVGSLRLDVHNSASADAYWELRGKKGTWTIEPFTISGVVNEIDHSGVWFDSANSGWGMTLIEQGDLRGGVLFTYDPAGEPVWAAALGSGTGNVEYFSYSGACPSCTYRAVTWTSAGYMSFNFLGESEMTVSNHLTLPMAAGVRIDGISLTQLSLPASARTADRQLANFDSEAALKAHLTAGMLNIPGVVILDYSPSPPTVIFSTTNLQEAGVDEADLVKSDGRRLYTYAYNNTVRLPVIRVAQTLTGAALDVLGTVALASGKDTAVSHAGVFLHDGDLVSITGTQPLLLFGFIPVWSTSPSWSRGKTYIEILNASIPSLPVTKWRAEIDGHFVSSRRIGQRLYVISRYVPDLPGFVASSNAASANEQILANTPLVALLPKVRINGGEATAAVTAQAVYAPPLGSQKIMADMILVTVIDLAQPRIAQTLGILGALETVYASLDNLFLASTRYRRTLNLTGALIAPEPAFYVTDLHQIRLGTDAMSIVGSGSIEGYLGTDPDKAAFRLSEYQGRLRAITSSGLMWGAGNWNRLTILEPSAIAPGVLKTVSTLPNAQRPETLGKPYEMLYGTRFVDDRLYAVTFKKADPLYVVDLSNSADPRIRGQLQLPGFSDYLHPLPNGLLLGFGKDARPANVPGDGQFAWYQGLQLTLFDVSNPDQPREMQHVTIGKRGSDSALLHDHHAFSSLAQSDGSTSIAIPARIHDGTAPQFGSGDFATYPWAYSGLLRFTLHGSTPADASLVQTTALISHSASQSTGISNDPGAYDGRSVLFRDGAMYIGNGQFWRQDNAGNTFGPF